MNNNCDNTSSTMDATTTTVTNDMIIYNTRQFLLEEIQYKLCLTPDQTKIKYPTSELDHITNSTTKKEEKNKVYEITLNELLLPKISFTLPLPQLTNEWGVARLILKLKLPVVINILMLLLLEKSILLIGDNYEEVSCCIFALIDLLKPYKWSSIFVPVISDDKMNVIHSSMVSNIPFIIGIVANDDKNKNYDCRSSNNHLPCMKEQQQQHRDLTIINMINGTILWTNDEDIRKNQLTHGCNIM